MASAGYRTTRRVEKTAFLLQIFLATLGLAGPVSAETRKRKLPDYDGRGAPSATPGSAALWLPRVLLFPLYLVSEYVIRRPMGAAISAAERAHLPDVLYNFFAFGPNHQAGWAPLAFVDFGFKPSVGAFIFWNNALVPGHDVRLHFSTWGQAWLAGKLTDRWQLGDRDRLECVLLGVRRPDYAYLPEGGLADHRAMARYGADQLSADVSLSHRFLGRNQFSAGAGGRSLHFYDPQSQAERSVREAANVGAFPLPAAYAQGYSALTTGASLDLDTRPEKAATGSYVRLDAKAEQGVAIGDRPLGWWRYGVALGGFLDLNQHGRVLGLSVASSFADPMTGRSVPFTELAQLGGSHPMPGFPRGWLAGRSALASTLSYRWPVWLALDGSLQIALGNVFGEHLCNFDPSRLRTSFALGLQTASRSDNPVQILVGAGTKPFEQGAGIDSFRFVVGTNNGF